MPLRERSPCTGYGSVSQHGADQCAIAPATFPAVDLLQVAVHPGEEDVQARQQAPVKPGEEPGANPLP